VCINYYAQYLDPAYGARRRALEDAHRAEFDAIAGRSWQTARERNALARRLDPTLAPPSLGVLVDHFAHVARIAGPEHVCLGSDFDGVSELPIGLDDVTDLPTLFRELEDRGLPVAAIAGENVLRVLAAQTGAAPAVGGSILPRPAEGAPAR
jgi:membrane dipeptidase